MKRKHSEGAQRERWFSLVLCFRGLEWENGPYANTAIMPGDIALLPIAVWRRSPQTADAAAAAATHFARFRVSRHRLRFLVDACRLLRPITDTVLWRPLWRRLPACCRFPASSFIFAQSNRTNNKSKTFRGLTSLQILVNLALFATKIRNYFIFSIENIHTVCELTCNTIVLSLTTSSY